MPLNLVEVLQDAVVMAPMTKGSNLPYRRLCDELGATITMGEMAVARQLKRNRRPEFALLRRSEDEKVFGVQLAGKDPEMMAWAAALAVERGADLVDVNLGCPIDEMTRRGLGSALLRNPNRIGPIVEAMVRAIEPVPVTVKIRLAYTDKQFVHVKVAKIAEDAGAAALTVHGRTKNARYRKPASWEKIGEVVESVGIPVVGNGDILWPHEIEEGKRISGCAGVMTARGALIKPWIFREANTGPENISAEDRVGIMRRYVELAFEHWGDDAKGRKRLRGFLLWHLGFWTRYIPPYANGTWPGMQERAEEWTPSSDLEFLLTRADEPALEWWADYLMDGEEKAGPPPPLPESESEGGRQEREEIPQG